MVFPLGRGGGGGVAATLPWLSAYGTTGVGAALHTPSYLFLAASLASTTSLAWMMLHRVGRGRGGWGQALETKAGGLLQW